MSFLSKIGHALHMAGEDTLHVAEDTVSWLPKVEAVLVEALKDEPAIKAAVLGLVKAGAAVVASGTVAVVDKGANLVQDAATVATAEEFVTYFQETFLPAVEALYKVVVADATITATVPAATSEPVAAVADATPPQASL
jgi:hypothetical protein